MSDSYEIGSDTPLYDVVGRPLSRENVLELLRRQTLPSSQIDSTRKRLAYAAYDVFRNRTGEHVLTEIRLQQNSKTIADDMAKLLTRVRNDAVDIANQIACIYKNGADRHIGGDDGVSDTTLTDQEKALLELAEECELDAEADEMAKLAWLQGPQFAVPMLRDGELRCDMIGPHVYDIVQNLNDPLGMPVGLAWKLSEHRIGSQIEQHVFVLDSVSLTRYIVHSHGGEPEGVLTVQHNYGRLPAGMLRYTRPRAGDDWHLADAQSRLLGGTIDVLVLLARMGLVRRAQNHNLLTVIGRLSSIPRGQEKADPEGVIAADTSDGNRGAGQVEIDVKPFDIDPINFIRHILFLVQSMIEPYGGHIQVDSGQPEIFGKIVIPPQTEAEHRKRQIKPTTRFEREFWGAAAAMLKAEGDPRADDLPEPDQLRKLLRADFGQLTRELEDPRAALEQSDWDLRRAQTSQVKIMQRRLGGATREEARRHIEANLEEQAWVNDELAKRGLLTKPMSGGEIQNAQQAFGSLGTPVREANRAADAAQGDAADGSAEPAPEPT